MAKYARADAVKFQTFRTEKNISKSAELANYQKKNIGRKESQFSMIRKLELSYDAFREIKKYCDKIGIEFLSTPDDEESLEFLLSIGMNKIKVGSGEITNIPYLKKIGIKRKDVILSTGMSCLGEIEKAYYTLLQNGAKSVSILHCTTNYPCPMNEVNLRAILTLKRVFNTEVGYSDHTLGIEVPICAVSLGASIIEKHFTLDRNMEGPDHKASLQPKELKAMVKAIRKIEKALGDGIKKPTKSEEKMKKVIRRVIVTSKVLKKGEILKESNVAFKRARNGIPVENYELVLKKKVNCEIPEGMPIRWENIID